MRLLKALYSLNINFLFINFLLYALAIVIFVLSGHSIGSEFSIFTGLGICAVAPIKPADSPNLQDTVSSHKPSRLTNEQKAKFNLTQNQQEMAVGLILGDLNVEKRKS